MLSRLISLTLVTPTRKHVDYEQHNASGDFKSGRATSIILGRAIWLAQAEAQFTLAGITSEQTKFYYVISQLDQSHASEIEEIIVSPPKRNPYTALKTELVSRLTPSKEQRIRELLTLEELGDLKPSQFPRHLRKLAPDLPDDFLRSIWTSRLPSNTRAMFAGQTEVHLDTAARCADRIMEAALQPSLASVIYRSPKTSSFGNKSKISNVK
jgi:hypothetical protein